MSGRSLSSNKCIYYSLNIFLKCYSNKIFKWHQSPFTLMSLEYSGDMSIYFILIEFRNLIIVLLVRFRLLVLLFKNKFDFVSSYLDS